MPKVNFMLDDEIRAELVRLIPPRSRSRLVNEVLRKELLRLKRELAMKRLQGLRKRTATFSAREIASALRHDRSRVS